jgi:hypothetical protein
LLLAEHHKPINHHLPNKDYKRTLTCFAGILTYQLIKNFDSLLSFNSPLQQELRSLTDGAALAVISIANESPESTSILTGDRAILYLQVLTDANQEQHHQIAYEKTSGSKGKRRTKTRPCVLCLANENSIIWLVLDVSRVV